MRDLTLFTSRRDVQLLHMCIILFFVCVCLLKVLCIGHSKYKTQYAMDHMSKCLHLCEYNVDFPCCLTPDSMMVTTVCQHNDSPGEDFRHCMLQGRASERDRESERERESIRVETEERISACCKVFLHWEISGLVWGAVGQWPVTVTHRGVRRDSWTEWRL